MTQEPGNLDRRPQHLPKGLWGWILSHVLAITLIASGVAAAVLIYWADRIFG